MVVFGRFGGGTFGEAEQINRPVTNVEGNHLGMNLRELIDAVPGSRVAGSADVEVDRLSADSRVVWPGTLFFALAGEHQDGHSFIEEAVGRGARAVVAGEDYRGDPGVPVIRVSDTRAALGRFSERFFDFPSSRLKLIGVTGTNGKTTTTYLIRSILNAAGFPSGLFGTIGYDLAGERIAAAHTTPESNDLQLMLSRLLDKKAEFAVMEVSSHALALKRVEGCDFDLAVFTNLTQDHLDFHGSMENYFLEKRRLFFESIARKGKSGGGRAVVNSDDPWGRRLIGELSSPLWSYGLEEGCDIRAEDMESDLSGLRFTIRFRSTTIPVRSPLVGRHNVYNILAAAGAALHFKISPAKISEGVSALSGVPGRFERFDSLRGFTAVVDYAHTEAALERLLRTVRELTPGSVITVFGCGGDRDRGKRAPMGRVAARYSDRVVVTSDNPRREDPRTILEDVEAGVREEAELGKGKVSWEVLVDRKEAIERVLGLARKGDSVVIAGKGHEDYQILGEKKIFFDDRAVVRDWIARSAGGEEK